MIRKPKMTLKQQSHAHHCEVIVQPPWKHSNKFPKDLQKTSLFVSDDKRYLWMDGWMHGGMDAWRVGWIHGGMD